MGFILINGFYFELGGIFQHLTKTLLKLAVCIVMDINEEWVTGKKYLSEED